MVKHSDIKFMQNVIDVKCLCTSALEFGVDVPKSSYTLTRIQAIGRYLQE
jgi:hypothetical protein